MKPFLNTIIAICALGFIAVAGYCSYNVLGHGNLSCTEEDGCLEIWQAAVLVVSLMLFVIAALKKDNSAPAIAWFCAMICYAGFLREVDFDKMELGAFADFMLYGGGRYATIILGFAAVLFFAALKRSFYLKASVRFIRSACGIFWIVAALLIGLAQELEHSQLEYAQFYEELVELLAYYFILASAIIMLYGGKRLKSPFDSDLLSE